MSNETNGDGGNRGNGHSDIHDEEPTVPGIPVPDSGETTTEGSNGAASDDVRAFTGIAAGLHRSSVAVGELAAACPAPGAPGRRRSLEVLAHALGLIGDLGHDTRRDIYALIREEEENKEKP